MNNPFAAMVGLVAGLIALMFCIAVTPAHAEGNDTPGQLVTLCQQTGETTPVDVLRDCAKGYQNICPGGYDLGQVIVNVTSTPYWVAAEVTCKPITKT